MPVRVGGWRHCAMAGATPGNPFIGLGEVVAGLVHYFSVWIMKPENLKILLKTKAYCCIHYPFPNS
jgi:hypothetical protein